jgi:hypothetical protein
VHEQYSVTGSYRYSTENDYWSHGGALTFAAELAQRNTTLALSVFGSSDVVGDADAPYWRKPQESLGARVGITQVLSRSLLAELSVESTAIYGYQASPYRRVGVGYERRGLPLADAEHARAEVVPDERYRHALIARARQALGQHMSLGIDYRFYVDSWQLQSQTLAPELAFLLGDHATLRLDYRYYTQNGADFYRKRYFDLAATRGYRTRDRELSAFYSQRGGLSYQHDFELGRHADYVLSTALSAGVTQFRYLEFVGLTRVTALEGTLLLGLTLP